jgi:hypothetical protein
MKLGAGAGGEPCRELRCDTPARLKLRPLVLARRTVAESLRAH